LSAAERIAPALGKSGMERRDATIFNIQALRAFAALSVAYWHLSGTTVLRLPFARGSFGVDIFFVISGYIISYISARDPSRFMLKRLIRIVPAYWAASLFIFALVCAVPGLFHTAKPDLGLLATSLAFLPHNSGANPILAVGWTLNYEMYFYALFALSLALSRRYASVICASLVLLVMVAIDLAAPRAPSLRFYGDSVVLEFIFGIVLFQATQRLPWVFGPAKRRADAALIVPALLIPAALALLLFPREVAFMGTWRAVSGGIPAALLVGSALLLELRYGIATANPVILLLGEASYVLYLIHDFVIYSFTRLIFHGAAHWPVAEKWLLAFPVLAITAAIAVGLHIWLERPAMAALRRRLVGTPSVARAAAGGPPFAPERLPPNKT
jgi:exopolysaccharide production protein ExoZ